MALNIDKQTGVKTPEKVVRVRTPVIPSSSAAIPFGDRMFPVAPLRDRKSLKTGQTIESGDKQTDRSFT
jgi:hypothetical protein